MPSSTIVGAGLDRQGDVVGDPRGAHLDVDGHLPFGDFAQLVNLDFQIVRPGPVGMAAGAALVDAHRQIAHAGDPLGDLVAQQHAAAARLGALADDHLEGVRPAQIVRVEAVARRQHLIDQGFRGLPLFLGHAAVAGGGAGAHGGGGAADGFLGVSAQGAEAHAGDGDGNLQLDGFFREAGAQGDVGIAAFPIAFQGIARDRGAEQGQIVEGGDRALAAEAADLVDAGIGGPLNFGDDLQRKGRRGPERARIDGHALILHPAGSI